MEKSHSRWALRGSIALAAVLTALVGFGHASQAAALRDKWCSKVHIRFFVGGAEGDAFGTIVYNGARQAAADTGAQVAYRPARRKPPGSQVPLVLR